MTKALTRSSIIALLAASPALADVTPAQVWQDQVDYLKASGYQITEGGRDEAGDTLTLTDVVASMTEADSTVSITMPKVVLQQTGGDVRMVYGDWTGIANLTDNDDEKVELRLSGDTGAIETTVSGSPDDMTYASRGPQATVRLDSVIADGKTIQNPAVLTLNDIEGSYRSKKGDMHDLDYDATVKTGKLEVNVPDIEDKGALAATFNLTDLTVKGQQAMPMGMVDFSKDMAGALNKGLMIDAKMVFGAYDGSFDFAGKDDDGKAQAAKGTVKGEGGELALTLSRDGIGYSGNGGKQEVEMTISDMPAPVKYALDDSAFDIQFPISASDAEQPYKIAYSIGGLTLGDELWSLFDPEKKLPRDPASIDLDVTGTARILRDLFDPKLAEDMDAKADEASDHASEDAAKDATGETHDHDAHDDMAQGATEGMDDADDMADYQPEPAPFEVGKVTINTFDIQAVGAHVQASGELTAPEGGTIDQPVGKINATYEGVNGLLDSLVAMGLFSQEDAMGYRMMMGAFAKPVEGSDDKMTTDLEFKEGNQIFANGQRIQ